LRLRRREGMRTELGVNVTFGLLIGGSLFLFAAWLGHRHALYIPAVVLLAAAVANLIL